MRPVIWPYKLGSASALALAQALNTRRVRTDSDSFKRTDDVVVINWGNGSDPKWKHDWWRGNDDAMLNWPCHVADASNKLRCFKALKHSNVRTVPWTSSKEEAKKFNTEEDVFVRTKLTGHSGEGIIILPMNSVEAIPNAPLYTKRIRGKLEYRIHVCNGEVIHVQQKRRREGFDGNRIDGIRNLANGYVFACHDILQPSPDVIAQAIAAVKALSLDFGAADMIQYKDQGYVLEINTAPGLEGTTLERYTAAFRKVIR